MDQDIISYIVSALVLGIASGLGSTTENAVKDAYAGLKKFIQERYRISLENLEQKPDSETEQYAIRETLSKTNAGEDPELLEKVEALHNTLKNLPPEMVTNLWKYTGVHLKDVTASNATFRKVVTDGTAPAVDIEGGNFDVLNFDDIEIGIDPKN